MEKMLDKDKVFKMVAVQIVEKLGLSSGYIEGILNILTVALDEVNLSTTRNELSTELCPNEVIIKNFLGCKKLEGTRDTTLSAYMTTINQFLAFKPLNLTQVTTNDVRRYLLYYSNKVGSMTTVDNSRKNLSAFFRFMEDEGYITKNPCRKLNKIKDKNRVKRFYSDLEMEMMRDNCEDIRETALIDFLLSTGLRVGEVAGIRISDINWQEMTVLVDGKTGERIVPFSVRAKKHMQEYLMSRGNQGDYLFVSSKPAYYDRPLGKHGIRDIIKSIGIRAGLPDISVHCIRRWLATDLCKKGVEPTVIQQILGHSSFQTTQSYYIEKNFDKTKYIHSIYAV